MYRINPLYRNVLITADEVVFHAPTQHTLDVRVVEQNIIIAEERLIRPALTDRLYYLICDAKNSTVTAENREILQEQITSSLPPSADPVTLAVGDIVNAMELLPAPLMKLWKQHLWKLTAECVMLASTPESFVQFGSAGIVHGVPASGPMTTAGEVSPQLATVKWAMDKKMMDRIDPLSEAMHAWLCHNKTSYPAYSKDCGCNAKGVAYRRKSDIVLGLYDDIDQYKNCGCYED